MDNPTSKLYAPSHSPVSWGGWLLALSFLLMGLCGPSTVAAAEGAATDLGAAGGSEVETTTLTLSNGLHMRVSRQGEGPRVLLLHGFPETGYSWRHQMAALAAAGYRAIAPDLRGYGGTDAPADVEAYDILALTTDVTALLDALGADEKVILVGHDWGAVVAWYSVLLHPERFRALVALSVPHGGRRETPPLETWRRAFGENFFYVLYFQQPGVAEKELAADVRDTMARIYASPGTPVDPPEITDPKADAGGWLPRMPRPKALPTWLTAAELDHVVAEFERTGFRGGLSYYRNFDRNWQLTSHLADRRVELPTLFVAGSQDLVIAGRGRAALEAMMTPVVPGLRGIHLIEGAGHWVHQERAAEVDRLLLEFLATLEPSDTKEGDEPATEDSPGTEHGSVSVPEDS